MVAIQLDDETAKKVIRQVEFYFSDSNIPRDTFLRNTINESEDGMVSLALICSFSRMRGHLGLGEVKAEDVLEDTVQVVGETIKTKSTTLKISEDGMLLDSMYLDDTDQVPRHHGAFFWYEERQTTYSRGLYAAQGEARIGQFLGKKKLLREKVMHLIGVEGIERISQDLLEMKFPGLTLVEQIHTLKLRKESQQISS